MLIGFAELYPDILNSFEVVSVEFKSDDNLLFFSLNIFGYWISNKSIYIDPSNPGEEIYFKITLLTEKFESKELEKLIVVSIRFMSFTKRVVTVVPFTITSSLCSLNTDISLFWEYAKTLIVAFWDKLKSNGVENVSLTIWVLLRRFQYHPSPLNFSVDKNLKSYRGIFSPKEYLVSFLNCNY